MSRATLREIFHTADRQLQVFFYTTNIEKYLQARLVFARYGLRLQHFRSRTSPYQEDYALNKNALLKHAIEEVVGAVGNASLVFVEDTSLRIDALSDAASDHPGLAVKEWFQSTNFSTLDRQLKQRRRGRRATIKSDIALHVPGLDRAVFFHGEVSGTIANSPPQFEPSPQFPWLSPNNFNGWFVPDGSSQRLGEMPFDASWDFDFRIKALAVLVEYLEELTAALNLPQYAYSRRQLGSPATRQMPLFSQKRPRLMVIGRTCAGKTTLGEHLSQTQRIEHIEASAIVRSHKERSGTQESTLQFAQRLLRERGYTFIAEEILRWFGGRLDDGFVITGFRTIEELHVIRGAFPDAMVVFVDTSERARFERHLRRGRLDEITTFDQFKRHDQEQWKFGLLRVANDLADLRLVNEASLVDYLQRADVLVTTGPAAPDPTQRARLMHGQLYRCLQVLREARVPLTSDEISLRVGTAGPAPLRPNNANKVLRSVPELAQRLDLGDGALVRYEILTSGVAYLTYVQDWRGAGSEPEDGSSP
jgi:inosine/xanthosine triphosphate pyrophosphatase family protein/adenylate kinase family enzyme